MNTEIDDSIVLDAMRYRWLRHGDNDEKVLKTYTSRPSEPGEPTMFLPRNDELDRLIDAARAAQEASMALSDQIEELAKKHGATSYRNRADTQHPAYGFAPAQLRSLVAEVRRQDEALILQLVEALEGYRRNHNDTQPCDAERAGRARLEGKP